MAQKITGYIMVCLGSINFKCVAIFFVILAGFFGVVNEYHLRKLRLISDMTGFKMPITSRILFEKEEYAGPDYNVEYFIGVPSDFSKEIIGDCHKLGGVGGLLTKSLEGESVQAAATDIIDGQFYCEFYRTGIDNWNVKFLDGFVIFSYYNL